MQRLPRLLVLQHHLLPFCGQGTNACRALAETRQAGGGCATGKALGAERMHGKRSPTQSSYHCTSDQLRSALKAGTNHRSCVVRRGTRADWPPIGRCACRGRIPAEGRSRPAPPQTWVPLSHACLAGRKACAPGAHGPFRLSAGSFATPAPSTEARPCADQVGPRERVVWPASAAAGRQRLGSCRAVGRRRRSGAVPEEKPSPPGQRGSCTSATRPCIPAEGCSQRFCAAARRRVQEPAPRA